MSPQEQAARLEFSEYDQAQANRDELKTRLAAFIGLGANQKIVNVSSERLHVYNAQGKLTNRGIRVTCALLGVDIPARPYEWDVLPEHQPFDSETAALAHDIAYEVAPREFPDGPVSTITLDGMRDPIRRDVFGSQVYMNGLGVSVD